MKNVEENSCEVETSLPSVFISLPNITIPLREYKNLLVGSGVLGCLMVVAAVVVVWGSLFVISAGLK